jgi:hypothetical protein
VDAGGKGRTTRRQVLKVGGLGMMAAVGVTGALAGPTAAARRSARVPLPHTKDLRFTTFHPLLGTTFTVAAAGGTQDLILSKITEHPTARPGKGECFSLIFSSSDSTTQSGTHTLVHPSLGSFGMFISPVGDEPSSQRYEAVVNRY